MQSRGTLLLLLLAGCFSSGSDGASPQVASWLTIEIVSIPTTILPGRTVQVNTWLTGDGQVWVRETYVVWDTVSHGPDPGQYQFKDHMVMDREANFGYGSSWFAPASGRMYVRAYARVEIGGETRTLVTSEEIITITPESPGAPVEEISLVIEGDDGEAMGGFGSQASDGSLYSLTGATYLAKSGHSITVWLAETGLPTAAASSGLVFKFNNWTSQSVDVYLFTHQDDLIYAEFGVPVPSSTISSLKSLAAQGIIGSSSSLASELQQNTTRAAKLVKGVSLAIGAASCVGGIISAPATLGATLALVAAPCGGFLISAGAALSGNETLSGISTSLDAYVCVFKDKCVGLALDLLGRALDDDASDKNTIIGQDSTSGSGVAARVTPLKPKAFQDAIITVTVFPRNASVPISLKLDGTDGYTQNETKHTGSNGDVTFTIPGGSSGVRDDYTATNQDSGQSTSGTFTYQ